MRSLITTFPVFPFPFPASVSGIVLPPNFSRATSYPHSRKAPSVNFMMLPLCTSVTEGRRALMAYWIALATRRWVPNRDIGLMPRALSSRILAPNWSRRNASNRVASGLPHRARHPGEVAHRADAGVQIEQLAQAHVERADAAPHRGRERPFDSDAVAADRVERRLGQPVARLLERLLPRKHLQPLH